MSTPDVARLAAVDVAVALRSFPRRYRSVVAEAAVARATNHDELMARIAPDGTTGVGHLLDVVSTLTLVERGLHQVLINDDPALHPAVLDAAVRDWDPPSGTTPDTLLDMLDDQCNDFADMVESVHTPDWSRPGHVADGGSLTAIDLAHEAVRVGVANLDALRRTLASLD
jgi:hypothetical protein